MKKETKDILGLLAIVLPIFILTLVWWFNSPLYAAEKEAQRQTAQQILLQTYNLGDRGPVDIDREALKERFGLTEDEINPGILLEEFERASSVVEQEKDLGTPININPIYYYIGVLCFVAPWGIASLRVYIKKRRVEQDGQD